LRGPSLFCDWPVLSLPWSYAAMKLRPPFAKVALVASCLAFAPSPAHSQQTTSKLEGVAERVEKLVESDLYRKVDFPTLLGDVTDKTIDDALADLGVSHTRRIRPDTIDYYEVLDIYERSLQRDVKRLFPSGIQYQGIGIVTRTVLGRTIVSHLYPGLPAAKAGILVGDEIVSVDGKPYHEIETFKGRYGVTAKVSVRRTEGAAPLDIAVPVQTIRPDSAFRAATEQSIRVIEHGNRKIGYVRLWTLHDTEVHDAVQSALAAGKLKDVDILIADLRGRWGGYVGRLNEVFTPNGTQVEFIDRNDDRNFSPLRWRKPVVAIVDDGARSAMEILAYTMKKNGATVVGSPTAGAVLGGGAYVLPDNSLLMLAIRDVVTDGERLEGKGLMPTIRVDNALPYAAGADPQFDSALSAAKGMLAVEAQ
jgi:carboxyl-terminal processing protease